MDRKKKVLIVEDDSVLSEALETVLKKEGYEVLLAMDGESAEEMLKNEEPDLVLLDLLLPVKSGFEVLKMMRKDEKLKDTSVVILSNFEQEASIKEGMMLGAKDYIVKSNIDIKDVPGVVKKYL